jgi:hypothetical protein
MALSMRLRPWRKRFRLEKIARRVLIALSGRRALPASSPSTADPTRSLDSIPYSSGFRTGRLPHILRTSPGETWQRAAILTPNSVR